MASHFWSGEMPWSLLQCCAEPVSIVSGVPPAVDRRRIKPSLLKMKYALSWVQLGASNRPLATYSTRRSVEAIGTVSSVLQSSVFPEGAGTPRSTFEKSAFSTTFLSCEQTPMPT